MSIIKALYGGKDEVYRGDYSITSLIDSPRIFQLTKRHRDELLPSQFVGDHYSIFLGHAVHHYLSLFGHDSKDNYISKNEFRMFYNYSDKIIISGCIDYLETMNSFTTIYDYKVTSVWSYMIGNGKAKPEWVRQLNLYRYLYLKDSPNNKVDALCNVLFFRDWSANDAKYKAGYPESPIKSIEVDLWDYDKLEKYLQSRVDLHEHASTLDDHLLPYCTEEETWERKPTYAIYRMNKSGKFPDRASKLYDDLADAMREAYPNGTKSPTVNMEERKGERVRCESYCAVKEYCNQYRIWKDGK